MRVLVTGSNGFIGFHLCKYLTEQGCDVIGLGRKISSTHQYCRDYFSCDLSTSNTSDVFNKIGFVDAVVHLAADMRHFPDEVEVVQHNCVGKQRLLEECERKSICSFVQLSSLPLIGKPMEFPITENHKIQPPTVYHATKRMQEILADYAFYTHGLRTVSLRLPAPIGKGMNPKTIFPTFVKCAKEGRNITIQGKGLRKQTYIHVRDISQAIWKSIVSLQAQGVYNLGSFNCLSNMDLAQQCISVLKSNSEIVFSGSPDLMDDYRWEISFDKLKKDTNFVPQIGIDEAIAELAELY